MPENEPSINFITSGSAGDATNKFTFKFFGRQISVPSSIIIVALCFLTILAQCGQNISLPLWIDSSTVVVQNTSGNATVVHIDSYFVYTFACISFVVIFGVWLLIIRLFFPDQLTEADYKYPQWQLMLVGAMDALNGVLVVFASSGSRTAPYLQAILANFLIPLVVIFRLIILRKKPTLVKGICALVVVLSLFLCLMPKFIPGLGADLGGGAKGISGFLWPMIFMFGFLPAAIMNVIQEKILHSKRGSTASIEQMNLIYFLFFESVYQLATAALMFWIDIVPWYGNAKDFSQLGEHWSFGISCFFGQRGCGPSSGIRGTSFILMYTLSYLAGGALMRYSEGATYVALVGSAVTPVGFIFWTFFDEKPFQPHVNWGNQSWFALASLVIMVPSIYFYNVTKEKDDENGEMDILVRNDHTSGNDRLY